MKVIPASFEIIEPKLQKLSIFQRLEYCGRICYKSEEKITDGSALPFVKRMLKNKHMSTLEMAVIHIRFPNAIPGVAMDELKEYKYLICSFIEGDLYVSGSVRAFLEIGWNGFYINECKLLLSESYPDIFEVKYFQKAKKPIIIDNPPPRHRCTAVKFVVNRATSHELVRHRPIAILQESQRYCAYIQDKFGKEITFIRPTPFFGNETDYDYHAWRESCDFAEMQYFKLINDGKSPQAARLVLPNSCKTELIIYTDTEEWKHILKLRTSPAADPSMREVMIPLEKEMKDKGYI